jgi:cell division protein FtsN
MANLDRGAYDADKLHDFDVEETDDGEKSRLPLLVLIALVVLASFGGVVWLAYTQGVERGRADAPKIIVAQTHPATPKIAPSPYAGLNIYQPPASSASNNENADTVPQPPAPLASAHPASNPPALRPSAASKPDLPPPPVPTVLNSKLAQSPTQNPPAKPPSAQAPAKTVVPPAPEKMETPPSPPAQTSVAESDTTGAEQPVTATGPAFLQIGSYKSTAEAMQSWNAFKARHAVAAGYRPDVQKVALGAKGIWYRLRLGGLADKKSAIELCEKLKAQGASCLIAR